MPFDDRDQRDARSHSGDIRMKFRTLSASLALITSIAVGGLAGCGGPAPSPDSTDATAQPAVDTKAADAAQAADLAAKERELAAREAELALQTREQELARREAELQAKQAAVAKTPAPKKTPPKTVTTPPKTTAVAATQAPPKPAPVKPVPIVVPAGTELQLGLSSDVSTKTAKVGDRIDARLAQDLVVNGRRAIAAGTPVRGSVTQVVSGSNKIGGVPTLALAFDTLELENGTSVAISGKVVQQGKSETGKDTAKIVGGTAAGAIIGHQISDDDKGTVIGGILGGAAGALAAKKTGGDVNVPAGTVVTLALDSPVQVSGS
jgi:hypothetical protein